MKKSACIKHFEISNSKISSLEKELEELREYISDKSDMLGVLKEFTKTRLAKMVDSDESLLSEFDDIFNSYKIYRDKELREAQKIAREACERLGFYGNPENYIQRRKDSWDKKRLDDCELILDYHHPNTDWVGSISISGKCAREFLARDDVKKFLEDSDKGEQK